MTEYDIWNHKTGEVYKLSDHFDTLMGAWNYVRTFLNKDDYEVREAIVIKKPKSTRPVGRPRLNLPVKPRHFLQVEREAGFDSCLLRVRQIMAEQDGCTAEEISQSSAVRYAVYMVANRLPIKLPSDGNHEL